ncbi:MAG: cytochrome c biogenesis protein CcdA [Candidatus Omnitrophica bacterium]|nr:cytochrome c biogenesis protein CcdA [Candidatus Omnitrophota bacterium]
MNQSINSIDYLKAFIGGIGLSFTPCVYPLIPVIAGYIGFQSEHSHFRGFVLSFLYVTGVAVTYALLGIFASISGRLFGEFSSTPAAFMIIGGGMIIMGLSMSGVLSVSLPNGRKFSVARKKGHAGAFIIGLMSGLIISPCTTPVLGGILLYLATRHNILYGAFLLLAFAYGMGLVLILAGAFSVFLKTLPRSGKWMMWVERAYSCILIGAGIYFVYSGIRRL